MRITGEPVQLTSHLSSQRLLVTSFMTMGFYDRRASNCGCLGPQPPRAHSPGPGAKGSQRTRCSLGPQTASNLMGEVATAFTAPPA